jgi:hypothetical protein
LQPVPPQVGHRFPSGRNVSTTFPRSLILARYGDRIAVMQQIAFIDDKHHKNKSQNGINQLV